MTKKIVNGTTYQTPEEFGLAALWFTQDYAPNAATDQSFTACHPYGAVPMLDWKDVGHCQACPMTCSTCEATPPAPPSLPPFAPGLAPLPPPPSLPPPPPPSLPPPPPV